MASDRVKLYTPLVRMHYVSVWKPDKNNKYGGTAIYDPLTATPEDQANFKALVDHCKKMKDALPGGGKGYALPFRKGGEIDPKTGDPVPWLSGKEFANKIVFSVKSAGRPVGIANRKMQVLNEAENKEEVYSGMYVVACVTPYAYNNESKGINLGLNSLVKIKDGEPLGIKSDPTEDFREFDADAAYGKDDSVPDNSEVFNQAIRNSGI